MLCRIKLIFVLINKIQNCRLFGVRKPLYMYIRREIYLRVYVLNNNFVDIGNTTDSSMFITLFTY